jgi:hypothetical protein
VSQDSSTEHETSHSKEQSRQHATQVDNTVEQPFAVATEPNYDSSLLGDSRLSGRGLGPVRAAVMRQAQRTYGNRTVQRKLSGQEPSMARSYAESAVRHWETRRASIQRFHTQLAVQRALLPAMTGQPAYEDGLTLATIKATAQDKPPRPVFVDVGQGPYGGGANKAARAVMNAIFGLDQSKWDLNDSRLLQVGEVHGNQVYDNKSGDLPATTTYVEYDVAKYKGDPKGRGGKRVVVGADGNHYYTQNHYTDFAPFTPA